MKKGTTEVDIGVNPDLEKTIEQFWTNHDKEQLKNFLKTKPYYENLEADLIEYFSGKFPVDISLPGDLYANR